MYFQLLSNYNCNITHYIGVKSTKSDSLSLQTIKSEDYLSIFWILENHGIKSRDFFSGWDFRGRALGNPKRSVAGSYTET